MNAVTHFRRIAASLERGVRRHPSVYLVAAMMAGGVMGGGLMAAPNRSVMKQAPQLQAQLQPQVHAQLQPPVQAEPPLAQKPDEKAPSENGVRVLGSDVADAKSCEQQTWPYIEQRCLKKGADKPATKTTGAEGDKAVTENQPVGSVTAIAPTPPVREMAPALAAAPATPNERQTAQPETTGEAAKTDVAADVATQTVPDTADIPLPPVKPVLASLEPQDESLIKRPEASDTPRARQNAAVPVESVLSRRDRSQIQREEREQARAFEREQRRLERTERTFSRRERGGRDDPNRIVRRWTEYSYNAPDGDRRVIVIRRGAASDPFFQSIR